MLKKSCELGEFKMDKGYILEIGSNYPIDGLKVAERIGRNNNNTIRLADYLLDSGEIDANKVIGAIFPEINADVFISHSHKDLELATQIAIDIKEKLNLEVFVDSCAWGNSANLLRKIDDRYCYNKSKGQYIYSSRNRSTAHVHMILTTALQAMIYRTPIFIFISSDCSISTRALVKDEARTDSAWIHMELKFSELLSESKHFIKATNESYEMSIPIVHEAPTSHLSRVSLNRLNAWLNKEIEVL